MDCVERVFRPRPQQADPRAGGEGRGGERGGREGAPPAPSARPTHMPGPAREVPAQDHVGEGSLLLQLPGEDGFHVAPEVCVWAQEGIKEQGHGALASALEAFGQVIQVLERGGVRGCWEESGGPAIP